MFYSWDQHPFVIFPSILFAMSSQTNLVVDDAGKSPILKFVPVTHWSQKPHEWSPPLRRVIRCPTSHRRAIRASVIHWNNAPRKERQASSHSRKLLFFMGRLFFGVQPQVRDFQSMISEIKFQIIGLHSVYAGGITTTGSPSRLCIAQTSMVFGVVPLWVNNFL